MTRELTDGQLLERFSTGPSDVAERAFEALVERHGAMVLRVCRAQLADPDDTHDAFQATFLILVKKARSLWVRDSLGPWLHQVAFRTASCARSAAARRRKHERRAAEMASVLDTGEDPLVPGWETILHEEINRLPECYRVPIVLCDLQGCPCEEVARRMGRPVGTVKCWRSRGRERLRNRLIRRGVAPSVALGLAVAPGVARAAVAEGTVRLAVRVLSEGMTAGEVPPSVHTLVKGVLHTMLLSKVRATATAVLASVFLTAGLGTVAWVIAGDSNKPVAPTPTRPAFADQPRPTPVSSDEKGETLPLTLREAILIGLENAEEEVWLISIGKPTKIAPRRDDIAPPQFKADIMAKVLSIETQYWNLAQAHAQVEAARKAVKFGEEILKREQADSAVGRGTAADVAEAAQRLEQFNLDLVTRTSDAITTERQLRDLLGMPSTDNRRIVPVTAPVEAELRPDWEVAKAAMLANQPQIVQAKARAKQAEEEKAGPVAARLLQEVIKRRAHSLARFFLEIEANYKQLQSAKRLKAAAAQRGDAQRAYYEEGRITVDRFLDAVNQYWTSVATEAQYKTTYNISMASLEEAKGTLLDFDEIIVVDSPPSKGSAAPAPCSRPICTRTNRCRGDRCAPTPLTTYESRPNAPRPANGVSAGKTFSFDFFDAAATAAPPIPHTTHEPRPYAPSPAKGKGSAAPRSRPRLEPN